MGHALTTVGFTGHPRPFGVSLLLAFRRAATIRLGSTPEFLTKVRAFGTSVGDSTSLLLVKNKGAIVDALALVRRLESGGFQNKQAEAITSTIMDVLMEDMIHSQEHQVSISQHELEKLRVEKKMELKELRYEMEKIGTDLRYAICDGLAKQNSETKKAFVNQPAELKALMAEQREAFANQNAEFKAFKLDIIKYFIRTFTSISAGVLLVLYILIDRAK